jgi:probable addiction module antidote protein
MKLKDFDETFAPDLSDPEFAAAYLAECLSYDEPEVFLLALRNVVKANSNMSEISRKLDASRASLYTALSNGGNPTYHTLRDVLGMVGLQLSVTVAGEPSAVSVG